MSQRLEYGYVKNYIENESGSNCKLLSREFKSVDDFLDILDKNGHFFKTTFYTFRNKNKHQCNKCSRLNASLKRIKYTPEEAYNYIKSFGFSLVSEYKSTHSKIILEDAEKYLYKTNLETLKQNKMPRKFHKSNPYTIHNIKLWLKLHNKNFELISDTYNTGMEKLIWKCLKNGCREFFQTEWEVIYQNIGCPFCAGKQAGLSNCLAIKKPELVKEWHPIKNKELTPRNVTCGSNKKVWWKCKNNHEWEANINNRSKDIGCPVCNQSKGEKRIRIYLENSNIFFKCQYRFSDLTSDIGNQLKFDFAIFENEEKTKLKFLIEYDGEFHFGKVYEGDDSETIQYHDKLKDLYCKNNNIKLFRIPYWDFHKIEKIIADYIISESLVIL